MTNEDFEAEFIKCFNRSMEVLSVKRLEYAATSYDRLEQFHRVATINKINPVEALWGMAAKHITAISDMAKSPTMYNLEQWQEKTTDLRNYTILLDALLIDLVGVQKDNPTT